MEDFQKKYIQDARELIDNLEGSLLKLEEDQLNEAIIEEIFRFMHTLKGSAGMFGFQRIEGLTHHLENVYDSIREGKLQIDDELTELTLSAVDVIKALLDNKEILPDDKEAEFNRILQRSKAFDDKSQAAQENMEEKGKGAGNTDQGSQTEANKTFLLRFSPQPYIYERGVRPKNVFSELQAIHEFQAFPILENLPLLPDLQPQNFYISWEILVQGAVTKEAIEDIFLFFEEDEFAIYELDAEELTPQKLQEISKAYSKGLLKPEHLEMASVIETKQENQQQENKPEPQKEQDTDETVRVSAEKLDDLVNLVSDFVTENSRLALIAERLQDESFNKSLQNLSKLSKRFRENALDLRLMPIEVLVVKFKRLVRDLSRKLNKEIEFSADGVDTKLDKSIIEKIENPLMHIIRNAIDHGIELPEERIKQNKPEKGVIRMVAFYSGASVFVQIRDDGKGIEKEYLKQKAIEKGIIKKDTEIGEEEVYNLIFHQGFSTAQSLSQVSGRGVGMDVVQKSITELRGEINIESEINLGTSITLKLPLTLSIIDALLVNVADWPLLVPISSVETVNAITTEDLQRNEHMQIEHEGKLVPLINLRKFMEIPGKEPNKQKVIVLNHEGKYYGMLVDKIHAEHQAVIKPLGYFHRKQEYLAGASILGDGSLALILNIKSLIRHKSETIHLS